MAQNECLDALFGKIRGEPVFGPPRPPKSRKNLQSRRDETNKKRACVFFVFQNKRFAETKTPKTKSPYVYRFCKIPSSSYQCCFEKHFIFRKNEAKSKDLWIFDLTWIFVT